MTLLIDLCNAIIAAEAKETLSKRYARIAGQAHIIIGASAKSGMKWSRLCEQIFRVDKWSLCRG